MPSLSPSTPPSLLSPLLFFLAFPLVFSPFLTLLIGGGKALRIWGVARSHFLGEQVSTIWFPAPPSHLLSSSLLVTSPQGTLKNVFPLSPVRQQSPKGIQFFSTWFHFAHRYICSRLPKWYSGKESACQCRRCGFNPWL